MLRVSSRSISNAESFCRPLRCLLMTKLVLLFSFEAMFLPCLDIYDVIDCLILDQYSMDRMVTLNYLE